MIFETDSSHLEAVSQCAPIPSRILFTPDSAIFIGYVIRFGVRHCKNDGQQWIEIKYHW